MVSNLKPTAYFRKEPTQFSCAPCRKPRSIGHSTSQRLASELKSTGQWTAHFTLGLLSDMFRVVYEDGDVENLLLQIEVWRFVKRRKGVPSSLVDITIASSQAYPKTNSHRANMKQLVTKVIRLCTCKNRNIAVTLRMAADVIVAALMDV